MGGRFVPAVMVVVVGLAVAGCGEDDPAAQRRERCQEAWEGHVPPPGYSGDKEGTAYVDECAARTAGPFLSPQAWERDCLADPACAERFGLASRSQTERISPGGRRGGESSGTPIEPAPTTEPAPPGSG